MTFNVHDDKKDTKDVKVQDIWVPPDKRNKGYGGRAMRGLTKYADKSKRKINLKQSPEPGQEKRLNDFYSKRNFKPNSNRKGYYTRDPK